METGSPSTQTSAWVPGSGESTSSPRLVAALAEDCLQEEKESIRDNGRSSSEEAEEGTIGAEQDAPEKKTNGCYVLCPLVVETPCRPLHKSHNQSIAEDTVQCCQKGEYTNDESKIVALPMGKALESTWLHPATAALPRLSKKLASDSKNCAVSVVQCGTLSAAEALVRQGFRTCVLNFASGRNPGGGFLRGANAQEEALARVTGLYTCLLKDEVQAYYVENSREDSCVYTDNIIVSPEVPVFRRDDGSFLDTPYTVGIITAPAPNFGVAINRKSSGGFQQIVAARRQRMRRVLTLCAAEGFDAVVLGAWGCGVFKNDPVEVAKEFRQLIEGDFSHEFSRVAFAVIDEPTCSTFQRVMAGERVETEVDSQHKFAGKGKGKWPASQNSSKIQDNRREKSGGKSDTRKARRWAKHSDVLE